MNQKLPVNIQSFRYLIEGGFIYVDKTALLYQMWSKGTAYFLSRPRRFGKSLLTSSLASLFRAERDLFKGTWIDSSDYPWESHPVIELDFSNLNSNSPEDLLNSLNKRLVRAGRGVKLQAAESPSETLINLVDLLKVQGKVVLLIDEYDRPLVRHLNNASLSRALRDALEDFFAVIKSLGNDLRFVFLTGVSRFSKVSLFSGLNNLKDISMHHEYATLTGITEKELRTYFSAHIDRVAQKMKLPFEQLVDRMRYWYNGYLFSKLTDVDRVYNPWSVLNFLDDQLFDNYWFESGTPSFAIDLIQKEGYSIPNLEQGIAVGTELETSRDVQSLTLPMLLFQTGYLTVEDFDQERLMYFLRLPNKEVADSLIKHLFISDTQKGVIDDWVQGES